MAQPVPHLLDQFVYFSQRQYDCLDYDPFHPLLVHLGRGLPADAALWLSTLYMAFYNIGSAWVAFTNSDPWQELPEWVYRLPVGVQRRNLRGGLVARHLADWLVRVKVRGAVDWVTRDFIGNPVADWVALKASLRDIWGMGRWGTYTTAELFQKVNQLPVLPTEIMNEDSTGPRAGLAFLHRLAPDTVSVEEWDRCADALFSRVKRRVRTKIFYLAPGHYDHGMLESQLCDFNSLRKGRYYIGRDIDRDQERIRATDKVLHALHLEVERRALGRVWEARVAVFEKRYLGEYAGWDGRTDYAKQYYVKTGHIADHGEILAACRAAGTVLF